MGSEITVEKVEKYIDITTRALAKIHIAPPECSTLYGNAEDFLNMAKAYYEDGKHFRDNGDMVNAFACMNYAHGWLDAGARLGFFDVGGDDVLFTLGK